MKRNLTLFTVCVIISFGAACSQRAPSVSDTPPPNTTTPSLPRLDAGELTFAGTGTRGTVTETMSTESYTYVEVDTGSEKIWAAAPQFTINVGDEVMVPEGALMRDFHSKSLERDFPEIYFVNSILDSYGNSLSQGHDAQPGHPAMGGPLPAAGSTSPGAHNPNTLASTPVDVDFRGLKIPDGGKTVSEIVVGKADLSGKEITLRARVVKFIPNIMGTNWLHVQDGSGDASAGTNDLTVTADVDVKVGDTVLVNGRLSVDKDFGYGYKYAAIIEDAKVTVE